MDQLVSKCPVHPGWRPTSTGQPKDNRNSKKWGWTLDADSTFLRIWSPRTSTDQLLQRFSHTSFETGNKINISIFPSSNYYQLLYSMMYYFTCNLLCLAANNLPDFSHLSAAFLSSSDIENKDCVKWSTGKQVQVADVIKKPWQG